MKSPRPKANPKRPPKSSPRPPRSPDSDTMSPKSVYERSIRPMAKGGAVKKASGGMCRGMGAATKGGQYARSK